MNTYKPTSWHIDVSAAPAAMPITLTELKASLNIIDNTDDDTFLTDCIAEATGICEAATNRAIIAQTRILTISDFPPSRQWAIELPGGAAQSVTSISYVDRDGQAQTMPEAQYTPRLASMRGTSMIHLSAAVDAWPDTQLNNALPVSITYVAGWADAASIPADFKRGVRMVAASLYENREAETESKMELSNWWRAFLATWRIRRVFP